MITQTHPNLWTARAQASILYSLVRTSEEPSLSQLRKQPGLASKWKNIFFVPVNWVFSLLRRRSLGSSRNIPPPRGEEYCVTSPKSVCVGGYWVLKAD